MRNLLAIVLLFSTLSFAQWTKLNSGTDASLRGVSAVDANVCWVTGSKGTVLRTTDGGKHWTKLAVPNADKLDFRDVEAFDANTAIIMSAGPAEQGAGKLLKTTDAGAHWNEVLSTDRKGVFFDSMAFWDHKRGILFSDPVDGYFILWTTEDGGDHWKQLRPRSMPPALPNEGAFAASGTAIAVAGKSDVWFGTGGASVSRVFHSPDRGQHWWVSETPIAAGKASAGVFGLAFFDQKHGIAVGGDYKMTTGDLTAIASTSDGGRTWIASPKPLPSLQGALYSGLDYHAIGNAYVVGEPSDSSNLKGGWLIEDRNPGNALSLGCKDGRCVLFVVGARGSIRSLRVGTD